MSSTNISGQTFFLSPDGSPMRLAELRKHAQRGDSFYAGIVRALERGELPDGWERAEDNQRDSRAGTGVYGYEH